MAGCLLSAEWPLGLFLFLNKPLAGLAEFAVFFGHKGFGNLAAPVADHGRFLLRGGLRP